MAWWYRAYAKEQSAEARGAMKARKTTHGCANGGCGRMIPLRHLGHGGRIRKLSSPMKPDAHFNIKTIAVIATPGNSTEGKRRNK